MRSSLFVLLLLAGCGGSSRSSVPGSVAGLPSAADAAPAAPTPSAEPAAAAPAPQPTVDPGPIAKVRVSFFGIDCGKGVPVPRNNDQVLPIRCRGFVTATPKDENGDDVPRRIHGPEIAWELAYGEGVVEVQPPTFESDFNKDLVGISFGAFGLCATVKGVRGCLEGNVQPR